mmetsp:Transcript_8861/g.11701  ORF Transcript_8861/g.11701 Transcript_8861/m.11701 type:complete len:307 (+) Transcript_8861:87-1007(+)|eukprot:CAMPEP_0117759210 /NCGR_PEP_ID=MMETSP0947-20121206/15875_1 /TAXON_ID=44440 /ORGANISM="Chattonella subsalsa, Strain CCMP2191" /LENGTH=306 /DNA_ID=CAMNT_0005579619 /DNA_START=178 /DNA_END=1098 /DNA_ORIENTATION=-
MEDSVKFGCFCGCTFFLLLLFSILLGISFDIVEVYQRAIRYDKIKFHIKTGIWKNGRHCVGPGQHLLTYPTHLQTFRWWGDEYIGAAWTKDKQEISLEVNVFWRYQTDYLHEIYFKYKRNPEEVWEPLALRTIKETTKLFDTTDFFDNRGAIQGNLTVALVNAFQDEYMTIHSLQMGRMVIPSAFETAVQNKVIKQQNEQTTATMRNVTLIEAKTAVITADGERKVTIISAEASADAEVIVQEAEAYAVEKVQAAYEQGYAKIAASLDLPKEQIAQYIWARSIKEREATSKLLVGFDGTVVDVKSV